MYCIIFSLIYLLFFYLFLYFYRKDRSSVVLATKCRFQIDFSNINKVGLSRRHIVESCEESLERLQTSYIDILQVKVLRLYKNSCKSRSLESNRTAIKKWKLQTRFYWVCSWEIISHVPWHRIKRYSILNTKCIGVSRRTRKIYNNTEMKSGRLFTAATQHKIPDVLNIKILLKVNPSGATKPKLQTRFYWVTLSYIQLSL